MGRAKWGRVKEGREQVAGYDLTLIQSRVEPLLEVLLALASRLTPSRYTLPFH